VLAAAATLDVIDRWDVTTGLPVVGPPWQPPKRDHPTDGSLVPAELGVRWASEEPKAKPSPAAAVAFSPGGDALVVTSGYHRERWQIMLLPDAGLVRVYDLKTGKERFQIQHQGAVVAFSPDGKLLATGGQECVYLWNTVTGKQRRRFAGHGGEVTALAFTADGRRLISGSADGTGLVWDVAGSP
jgi:WD40 repeat protein